ncbi:MAG: GGDEF domain-containing protein [Lachnospiraceae bacterium]|nr:GGDEF domain-containing protein [Lachnospiraceae bacterium]
MSRSLNEQKIRDIFERFANNKYYVLTTLVGSTHVIFCLIFFYLKVWPMAVFNIFSPVLYFYVRDLAKKNKAYVIFIYSYAEIVLHGILATYFVGWDTGFAQFIIAVIPFCFFAAYDLTRGRMRFLVPSFLGGIASVIYVVCRMVTYRSYPYYELSQEITGLLFVFNSICVFTFMFCFLLLFTYTLNGFETKLKKQNAILDYRASTDPLTSLLNRRSMRKHLDAAFNSGEKFSVAMCDIDDFKNINDSFGHEAGDLVLKELTGIITDTIPAGNPICRWGGEEILILFNNCGKEEAADICEEVRQRVADRIIPFYQKTLHVTLTIGVSEHQNAHSIEETIFDADNKLYHGKKNGKDQVVSVIQHI